MNTHDLEAFLAVVETGSIVAASTRLNVTQPGITRRIQNLEHTLGAALLDRQSKPLRPTAAGREAYEHARRVLRSLEDMKSGLSRDAPVTGEFRLGITPSLSEAALAAPVDRLRGDFPQLTLQITAGWSPQLLARVSRSELDAAAVGLVDGQEPPADLAADDLGAQPVVLIASRELDIPEHATLRDLSRFPWVMNPDGCGFRAALKRSFEAARLPFHIGVEALSADLRLSLVERGLGIGLVTAAAFAANPPPASIKRIDSSDFHPQVRAWVVYRPPLGRLGRPITTFRDALATAFAASHSRFQEKPDPVRAAGRQGKKNQARAG
ncbi:MAG TPA: LysR family transcriptional regulator [Xanthobacteraceae bacterium]|nr:LysR family transcriptional regulator [Xanthobacteraceae bacterium]